jgi:hypothetical protein
LILPLRLSPAPFEYLYVFMLDVVDGLGCELQREFLRACGSAAIEGGYQSKREDEQSELPERCGAMFQSHVAPPFSPIYKPRG